MKKTQLLRFIRIRNSSDYSSNLQFLIDAEACGFKVKDLGKPTRIELPGGFTAWTWNTEHGYLVEVGRSLNLYPNEQAFKDSLLEGSAAQ